VQRHAGAVVVRASRRHARVQRASRATPLRCCASSDQQQQQQQQQQEGQQPHAQQQAPAPSAGAVPMYVTLSALASAGAAETAYLAATKLLDVAAACPTSGCDSVLNSPFGSLFGLPLPLFGAATYGGVALAAGLAAAAASRGARVPRWLGWGLAGGVGVLATTSAALMAILHTQLGGAPCLWCYASAGISAALLATLLAGMEPRQLSDAAAPGLGGTVAAALVLYLGFGSSLSGSAAELELPYASPVVTTASSEQALALARRLRESGAAMYGAFWCSHCYDQKQEFGAAAMKDFPYVECFPEGWKKVRRCCGGGRRGQWVSGA
jgi:uncharacterized membrane protein